MPARFTGDDGRNDEQRERVRNDGVGSSSRAPHSARTTSRSNSSRRFKNVVDPNELSATKGPSSPARTPRSGRRGWASRFSSSSRVGRYTGSHRRPGRLSSRVHTIRSSPPPQQAASLTLGQGARFSADAKRRDTRSGSTWTARPRENPSPRPNRRRAGRCCSRRPSTPFSGRAPRRRETSDHRGRPSRSGLERRSDSPPHPS